MYAEELLLSSKGIATQFKHNSELVLFSFLIKLMKNINTY